MAGSEPLLHLRSPIKSACGRGGDQNVQKVLHNTSAEARKAAEDKNVASDRCRFGGLCFFWLSLVFFAAGCWFGAKAVLS
jgi:hypothetical protein